MQVNQTLAGANRSLSYAYTPDKLNRASVTENGTATNFNSPSRVNQYASVGTKAMTYDTSLNLQTYASWSYSYDAENRLLRASIDARGSSHAMTAIYDGLGRCLQRTVDGVTTTYVYDEWSAVNEFTSASTNNIIWNLFGPGGPDDIQMRVGDQLGTQFYHKDREGNVNFVTEGTTVREQYLYDAFGTPYNSTGTEITASSIGNRYLFTGREYFFSFGIYDYRHRVYHPKLGRFLQLDPKGFDAGDMNLFRYCDDDPVDRTDPTGLYTTSSLTSFGGGQWAWYNGGIEALALLERRLEQPAGNGGGGWGSGGTLKHGVHRSRKGAGARMEGDETSTDERSRNEQDHQSTRATRYRRRPRQNEGSSQWHRLQNRMEGPVESELGG